MENETTEVQNDAPWFKGLTRYSPREIENLANSTRIEVARNTDDIYAFIDVPADDVLEEGKNGKLLSPLRTPDNERAMNTPNDVSSFRYH